MFNIKTRTYILIVIFIIICSVSLFLFYGYKTKRDLQTNFALKAKCLDVGKKTHDEWVQKYSEETFILDPIYTYNSRLNTCLYAQSYIGELAFDGSINVYVAFILDVYSNKTLIEYETNNSKQIADTTKEEFNTKYKELFNTSKDFYFFTSN